MKPAVIALSLAAMTAGCSTPHAPRQYDFGSAAETQRAIRLTLEHVQEPEDNRSQNLEGTTSSLRLP